MPTWLVAIVVVVTLYVVMVIALIVSGRKVAAKELAFLLPNLVLLFKDLLRDPAVSRGPKIWLAIGARLARLPDRPAAGVLTGARTARRRRRRGPRAPVPGETGRRRRRPIALARRPRYAPRDLASRPDPRGLISGRPPRLAELDRLVLGDRTALESELHQVGERLADLGAGLETEHVHHLPAVQRRAHRLEVLLLGERGDPLLELVLQLREGLGALLVAGRDVGAGELVQPVEQRPRVADEPTDRGVGPRAVAVPVEPQVQLDQRADVVDHGPSGTEARSAASAAIRAPSTS